MASYDSSAGDQAQSGSKDIFQLHSGHIWRVSVSLVIACAVAQVFLGANLLTLAAAVVACIVGLAAFRIAGAHSAAGWFALFFILGNGVIAVVAKTLLGQPIDKYLRSPVESYLLLAIGAVILLVSVVVASAIPVGRPVFRPTNDTRVLSHLSTWSFVLGFIAWYANRLYQDPDGSGFGGVSVFWNLVLMSIIARTALILEKSDGRRSMDLWLTAILAACVVMGLIGNSKTQVALPLVAYFAAALFLRNGFRLSQLLIAALFVLAMGTLIAPMVHAYRALGIHELSWSQRAVLLQRGIRDVVSHGLFDRYERLTTKQFVHGYYDYFGEGKGQVLLGRYASIQQIDPVVAQVNSTGTVGGDVVLQAFTRLIPSAFYPNKPKFVEDYHIVVRLGLIDPEGGKFPTVPLIAQSYAAYGFGGVLSIPLLTLTVFLLAYKKLGWNLRGNVFAIFFLCVFVVVYANQGNLNQYAGAVMRNFPLLALVVWLLVRIPTVRRIAR